MHGGGGEQQQLRLGGGALYRHGVAMSAADALLEVHSFVSHYRCAVMAGCDLVRQYDVYFKRRRSACLQQKVHAQILGQTGSRKRLSTRGTMLGAYE